ncbi:C3a anaphylatoxin chemotactic receptor-like [Pelobates fuscus]|uniref:C3a anaphylatoxin chemotactic receptor-like n=1 Tax=Pelobates fuscus TaxID=191477 RepID=UPI002FE43B30
MTDYYGFTGDYDTDNYTFDINSLLPTRTPLQETLTTPYEWAALGIFSLVFVIGVPGNGLVVWMTAFEMKRTVNTVWFLNLAVADLLCCFVVPFSIMELILQKKWLLGLFACKTLPSVLLVNMYASVLLLTLISIDRCALVVRPVWCQNKRTVHKAYVACGVVWIFAFVLTSPSFIFRQTILRNSITKCIMDYTYLGEHQQKVENFIAIFRFLVGFVIPFFVITITYSVLVSKVRGRFTESSKTLKVVLVVITAFFICWFPYHVAGLILAAHNIKSALYASVLVVDPLLIAIAFINSCVNPIIYVLMGQDFKSKFRKSIKTVLRNVLAEETSRTFDSKNTKFTTDTKNSETPI